MNSQQRRKHRRQYTREVEQRILEDEYDNMFTSHQYIEQSGFVDFLFIGTLDGKTVLWNACMTTAKGDYYEHVSDIAMDEAYEKFPDPEGYEPFTTVPCVDEDGNKNGMRNLITQPEHETFMYNRYRWMSERTIELLDNKEYSIPFTQVEIDHEYKYGIGLHIRINKDHIDVNDVKEFITAYNNNTYEDEVGHMSLTSKELEVGLDDDSKFVQWTKPFSHNTVAIKMDLDD